MRIVIYLITMLIVCFSVATVVSADHAEELAGLDDFIEQAMAASGTPGLAVSVVSGDQTIHAKGYGLREAGKHGSVDENTVFAIGSNSKYFTATAVGLLVAEGKLDWDESLTRYLPDLRFSDPYLFTGLTLRDALSHRTGLERADIAWYVNPDMTRDDVIQRIEKLSLEIPYRSGFLYNNFMFLAAGQAIPAVSDQSWDEVVQERIFTPLNMERSNTSVNDLDGMKNVATPHAVSNEEMVPVPYYNLDHLGPAGSINSSVADMSQWCKAQLADGQVGDPAVIPKSVIDDVRAPQNLVPLDPEGHVRNIHGAYSLGIARVNYGDHVAYIHTGGIDGMLSAFAFIPDAQLCAVVLTNSAPNYGLNTAVISWVLDHALNLDDKDYLAVFNEKLLEQKEEESKVRRQHDQTHDEALRPSLEQAAYANTYSNDVYGELVIEETDGQLRFSFGSLFQGQLKHHKNDSFDAAHDEARRNTSEPFIVNFALNAGGEPESVLLEVFGEESTTIRFSAITKEEP